MTTDRKFCLVMAPLLIGVLIGGGLVFFSYPFDYQNVLFGLTMIFASAAGTTALLAIWIRNRPW